MGALSAALLAMTAGFTTAADPRATHPLLEWVKYTFHAGHVCEHLGGVPGGVACRSYAHTVMFVAPQDVTSKVVGGGSYRLDAGAPVVGGPAVFERHLVESNGNVSIQALPNGTQAQMWNWGYDAVRHGGADLPGSLPQKICIAAWFLDQATGDANTLDEVCIPMVLTMVTPTPRTPRPATGIETYFQPDRSAAHHICTPAGCRLDVHIVFKATTGGSPRDDMVGGAVWSFDDGPWVDGGSTFYEQHIDSVNGTIYSAMQADFELLAPAPAANPHSKVCFKVWVQNIVTSAKADLATPGPLPPGWISGNCLSICRTLHAFHTPYCP